MIMYLMDKDDFAIKGVCRISSYDLKTDIDLNDSSTLIIADYFDVQDGDFALLKEDSEQVFFGVCKEIKVSDDGNTLTLKQPEAMFDTTIYYDDQDLIRSDGIEDYIVKAIQDQFTAAGDTLMDKSFVEVSASTHTPLPVSVGTIVDVSNGVFNFKTFLGNAREYYGVFLDFTPDNGKLYIDVNVREQENLKIDTKLPEVMNPTETYSVSVLAKLIVKWSVPDTVTVLTDDESTSYTLSSGDNESTITTKTYYFLSDRTISKDADNEERVDGTVKTVYIEAETEDEMYESVTNEFQSNSYNHSVSAKIRLDSKIYDPDDFYVGRNCTILTEQAGALESIITEMERTGENYVTITLGKLPVTLTKKLRRG